MESLTISIHVHAPIEKVWEYWSTPEHIIQWSHASDDWHTPHAENDLRTGGKFSIGYAARDGSASFDFTGTYTRVVQHKTIEYTIGEMTEYELEAGRKVQVSFEDQGKYVLITETFEMENIHTVEEQRSGWQSILENFKIYAEKNK
ncbi:MAG: SRPBCC domain-containing protein [Candidatus Gracilibacteria bacterium]|nr:SRPBCC domain-containing protein [Candidatus Gracilibacteria bacterium]